MAEATQPYLPFCRCRSAPASRQPSLSTTCPRASVWACPSITPRAASGRWAGLGGSAGGGWPAAAGERARLPQTCCCRAPHHPPFLPNDPPCSSLALPALRPALLLRASCGAASPGWPSLWAASWATWYCTSKTPSPLGSCLASWQVRTRVWRHRVNGQECNGGRG